MNKKGLFNKYVVKELKYFSNNSTSMLSKKKLSNHIYIFFLTALNRDVLLKSQNFHFMEKTLALLLIFIIVEHFL